MDEALAVPASETLAVIRRLCRDGSGRRIRLAANVSAAELAAELGVSEATVLRWETGRNLPRRRVALRYAILLRGLAQVVGEPL